MNKTFVIKMLRAKQMEFDAFRELIPEGTAKKMVQFKNEAKELIKECAVELYLAGQREKSKSSEDFEKKTELKSESKDFSTRRPVKKVTIE